MPGVQKPHCSPSPAELLDDPVVGLVTMSADGQNFRASWSRRLVGQFWGSDNLSKAHAKSLATEKAMRDRFPDYQSRYQLRYS
jgi:hypothetical protein